MGKIDKYGEIDIRTDGRRYGASYVQDFVGILVDQDYVVTVRRIKDTHWHIEYGRPTTE